MTTTIIRSIEDMPLLLTANDIAATGICGRNKAYELLNQRGFPVIKIGNKKVVPKDAFLEWLRREVAMQSGFVTMGNDSRDAAPPLPSVRL